MATGYRRTAGRWLVGACLAGAVAATGWQAFAAEPAGTDVAIKRMGPWGFDLSGMDTTVKPGDDFNAYVNGGWAKTAVIPADRSSYGAFAELREQSDAAVRSILEGLPGLPPTDDARVAADRKKLSTLLASFMDETAIEKRDIGPVAPILDGIKAVDSREAMAVWMGKASSSYGISPFGFGISPDQKNPEYYVLGIRQSGLGLPDRDYYLTERFAKQKAAYQAYAAKVLEMAGWPEPAKAAADVVAFETKMAEVHWSRAESRDRDKTYNPVTIEELMELAPGFEWRAYLVNAGLGQVPRAIVGQKSAFPKLSAVYASTDIETLKSWQAFHVVDEAAPLLSKRFVDASFEFKGKTLTGTPQQRDRIKRGVSFVESVMGEAVGREYVAKYFPPESKMQMEALVADITAAMKGRIEKLQWMTPTTREKALAKLARFRVKIGYPVKWRDYGKLEVTGDDLIGNSLRARKFRNDIELARLGQKVDREEWGMTPQTVNAYYNPSQNEIVFPAAILQPPFFDPKADPAVNYGAIGGVIAHEITHGFDDQGRKSDGDGVLRDWWTLEDAQKFEAQAFKLGAQYESYQFKSLPNAKIVGRLTMGENIADLGGALLGLDAYHIHLAGKPAPVLDGFTGDQRVFLGWAQVWRSLQRDAALQQQLTSDPHSPGSIRAFAPLRNVDAWYEAFGVKPGDKQYIPPEDRVRIW